MRIMRARSPWPVTIAAERRPSFITNYIEAETHALLLRKLGRGIAREWLLTGGLTVVPALPAEEQKAKEILARHTDKDWTLCDAISFAVLCSSCGRERSPSTTTFASTDAIQVLGLTGDRVPGNACSMRVDCQASAFRQ